MRDYLILKEKAQAFRTDPEVAEALEAARVGELAVPTLGEGESLDDLRAQVFDPEALGERGLQFERLDQLAMEHLLGVRCPRPERAGGCRPARSGQSRRRAASTASTTRTTTA